MTITSDQALALVHEYTQSEPLRRHMYAVELSMRALAEKYGESADEWGLVGLLHDFDYERFPNAQHSATDEHPAEGVRILAGHGLPDAMQRAILGHATYTGVPRDSLMARALFAADELSGFLVACAMVRPNRSLAELEAPSVRKKLKDKAICPGRQPGGRLPRRGRTGRTTRRPDRDAHCRAPAARAAAGARRRLTCVITGAAGPRARTGAPLNV